MGGWSYMDGRLRDIGYEPLFVGRDASASPATGSHHVHDHEQSELVEAALAGSVPHQVKAAPRWWRGRVNIVERSKASVEA